MIPASRILITGGAGSLGTNLVEHLIPLGHEVVVIDNFATGHRSALPEVERLSIIEGSISDERLVAGTLETFEPEFVIHSAASYKDPSDWKTDIETNVRGAAIIARESERTGVKRLINFQTALCYGIPDVVPIPTDHPCRPFTSYGISKTAGEQYILNSRVPSVSVRLANVTAPRLSIGPLPAFYQRLSEGKKCFCSDTVRDFLDVADFLQFVDIALEPSAPTGVFNLSTGIGHSIKEIFDLVVEHLGVVLDEPVPIVPPQPDDVPKVVLDPTSTTESFGWRAEVSFSEMVSKMLRWYDSYGVSQVYSHLSAPPQKS